MSDVEQDGKWADFDSVWQENLRLKGMVSQLELKLAALEEPRGDWWPKVEAAIAAMDDNWKQLMSLLVHSHFRVEDCHAECVNLRKLLFVEQQTNRELLKELAEVKAEVKEMK